MENKVPRVISRENSLYTGYNTPCGTKIVPKAKKQAHKSPFYGHLRAFCNYSNSTNPNQFCLEIILCRIRGAFDYLIYPYYPAYMG